MNILTIDFLKKAAKDFATSMSQERHDEIVGVTDGKAVGTFVEKSFKLFLRDVYSANDWGNAASGVDLPTINTDIKCTSIKQPQSSLPFKNARQKLFGLGYNLLVFVYEKDDSQQNNLIFKSVDFVESQRTGDYLLSKSVIEAINKGANDADLFAIFEDKNLPGDDIVYNKLVKEVRKNQPKQGYLTISNALQWRAQYSRIILVAGTVEGVDKIYGK